MAQVDYTVPSIPEDDLQNVSSMEDVKELRIITNSGDSKNIAKNLLILPAAQTTEMAEAIAAAGGHADEALQAKIDAEAAEAQTLLYRDAAAAIVSGGPRGAYDNLAALNAANPDHSYTYVTKDNGYWNYWNGLIFTAGSVWVSSDKLLVTPKLYLDANIEQYNALLNAGETGFPQSLMSPSGGTTSPIDTPSDCPFPTIILPKILSCVGGGSGDFKTSFATSLIGTGAVTFSFWTKKTQLATLSITSLSMYSGSGWVAMTIPSAIGDITSVSMHGTTTLMRVAEYNDWVMLQVKCSNITYANFWIRFGSNISGTLYLANITGVNSAVDINPLKVRYNTKKSATSELLAEHDSRLLLLEKSTKTLDADKEQNNFLLNAGETGFPQELLNASAGAVSSIDTPSDCPFPTAYLPKILSYVGNSTGEFKFYTAASVIGSGAMTLSFWTKKSQLTAIGCSSVKTYSGSAWASIAIPTTINGLTTASVHGTSILKRVAEYNDWVMLQLSMTNMAQLYFMLKFGDSISGTLYLANIISANSVTDISPVKVRYKLKNSTVAYSITNHETRLAALEASKVDVCFGDSLTAGLWPSYLQIMLGANHTIINRGVGGESSQTIIGRQGAIPLYVSNITIPAGTTPVVLGNLAASGIKSMYSDGYVTPLLQHTANAGINNCYVAGIECILAWTGSSYSDTNGQYTLTRVQAGSARTTGAKEIIYTENMRLYKEANCAILFAGANGGWDNSPANFVSQLNKMVNYLSRRRFIIPIAHTPLLTPAVQAAVIAEFGAHVINLKEYFATWAIYDAGLTPTQADLDAMALGNCPPQLMSDGTHYTAAANQLVAYQVYLKMRELGYI